ncbi:MAG: glycosyltransferase [Thermoleophilia bacterium]|nr:glycosyltransferase [Thermoleophilia bacterium]
MQGSIAQRIDVITLVVSADESHALRSSVQASRRVYPNVPVVGWLVGEPVPDQLDGVEIRSEDELLDQLDPVDRRDVREGVAPHIRKAALVPLAIRALSELHDRILLVTGGAIIEQQAPDLVDRAGTVYRLGDRGLLFDRVGPEPLDAWSRACIEAAMTTHTYASVPEFPIENVLVDGRVACDWLTPGTREAMHEQLRFDPFRAAAIRRARNTDKRIPPDSTDEWLAAPVERGSVLSRYLYEVWNSRVDLQLAHPVVDRRNMPAIGFLQWLFDHGQHEEPVDRRFVPSVRPKWPARVEPTRHGVRVSGYLRSQSGIGEVARRIARSLEHAGIEVAVDAHERIPALHDGTDFLERGDSNAFDVNVICVNADGFPDFIGDVGAPYFDDRYNIGVWFWETTSAPPHVDEAVRYVDELWVASEYVRGILVPHVGDTPIYVMPIAIAEPVASSYPRAHFELPDDAFVYGFMCDLNSTLERKNVLGLVDAYRRAYPQPNGSTVLAIKTLHAQNHPESHDRLILATDDRQDILLIDRQYSIDERDTFLHHLDCYVSLHRSEGFGLTIAEAALAQVPVVATGYSANIEFADRDVCYLVDYSMVPVAHGVGPYPAGGAWAEPDLDHAARLMRRVREHPAEAQGMARVAAALIRDRCSLLAASQFMRARLNEIWASRPLPSDAPIEIEAGRADALASDPVAARWLGRRRGRRLRDREV